MTALNIYISNLIKQGMYLVQLVLWGSLAVSAVLYVVSIFGDLFWISDMLHNFALHLLLFFVGFFLFSLLTAQRKLASMALIFVILQSYHIHRQLPQLLPFDIEAACTQCSGEEISLFQYNLLFSNPRVPQLVNWLLEDLEHDILVFQEATSTHQEALAPLSFAYPFVYHHKDISLFSRLPMQKKGLLLNSWVKPLRDKCHSTYLQFITKPLEMSKHGRTEISY